MTKKFNNENLGPCEKFEAFGAEALTETELLAVILRSGSREAGVMEISENILKLCRYPRKNLKGIYDLSIGELMDIRGVGKVKAIQIKCIGELSKRIQGSGMDGGIEFKSPKMTAEYFMEKLRYDSRETVVLLCLDTRGRRLSESVISIGNVRKSLISPREIFIEALKNRAVNIIVVHNHPSGDPTPSESDFKVTENLERLGRERDIPLLDHIIIGDGKYTSFRDMGLIE